MDNEDMMELKIKNDDMRRVTEMADMILGTLSQVGDYELPDHQKFVGEGFSYTLDEIYKLRETETEPLQFAEKALFLAYFLARKLAERAERR